MSDLGPGSFDELFRVVHGHAPFAWQQQLAARALEGRWPDAVDVPTGLGKTAVIDIAVFCLAAQADRPAGDRTPPMRTFVVVDRRIIVDQAYARAQRLRAALQPERDDIAGEIARRLLRLCAGTADPEPLAVVRMRGGITWESGWLRSTAQPAVVCGTVDQVGSRLLFRGYGVGTHRRPIDAALTGTDRLLFLDEAHLSLPLVLTSQSVDQAEAGAERPVLAARRPPPILLSATPPLGAAAPADVFRADPALETSEEARARLDAQRLARLVDVKARDEADFFDAVASLALAQAKAGAERTLVVVNTVGAARQVYQRLGKQAPDADLALLIGRCRPIDRDRIAAEWLADQGRLSAERPRTGGDRPAIAVATQTVEVGADLDVDALVTEACPLDSLLQRLGRLDRRGLLRTSNAIVVHQEARHGEDAAVYGPAVARTWSWLCAKRGSPPAVPPAKVVATLDAAPSLDLGPRAIDTLLAPGERSALAADPPLAPVALGVQLAAWARTDPAPSPDEDVAAFLHGINRGRPQVQVVWRAWAGLTAEAREADLSAAPLAAHEAVAVSIGDARRFLAGEPPAPGSDVEFDDEEPLDPFDEGEALRAWLVDPDGRIREATGARLRPGWTLVLDAGEGGHDAWGWTGRRDDTAVMDVADLGTVRHHRGASIRLREEVLRPILGGGAEGAWRVGDEDHPEEVLARVQAAVGSAMEAASGETGSGVRLHLLSALRDRCEVLAEAGGVRLLRLGPAAGGIDPTAADTPVILATATARRFAVADAGPDGTTSGASAPVGLDRHLRDVEDRAGAVAQTLGLDDHLVAAVAFAGLAHDLGKADRRFQAMLHGGSALRAEAWGEPLAKSGMDPADRAAFRLARQRSGWPAGMRHEAISAAILERILVEQPPLEGVDLDLVRHLVVTHHGRARPLLPPVTDDAPVDVEVALPGQEVPFIARSDDVCVDWEGPSRFARLGHRYGWWGLALLEAIVRLADQAVSGEYAASAEQATGPWGQVREGVSR